MALVYGNRISFLTTTTGTGTINVGSPLNTYQLPAGASIASGSQVGYTIIDGSNWEVGTGIYTTGTPPTLSRVTVEDSSSGPGVLQNLDGNAIVSFVVTAAMYTGLAPLASPALTGTPTAPTASSSTNTTQIATTAFVAPSFNDIGRNKVHNPLFNVAQRGPGAFSTNGYTVDRWFLALSSDTSTVTQLQFNDAQRTTIGDEEANNCIAVAINGNAGAGAFTIVYQPIENVRRLANRTVTISFWAYATVGTPKVGVGLRQYMGTGGSPSGNVDINATAVTLSSTLTRYSVTITLASLSGLTLGSNNDHYTRLAFFFSSGSTNNALAGGIGVQTGTTVVMWGVQLEIGSVMTPLEKPDPRYDLSNCQRFYQYHTQVLVDGYNATGLTIYTDFPYPVTMRAVPTAAYDTASYSNASAYQTNVLELSHIRLAVVITSTGNGYGAANIALSADL